MSKRWPRVFIGLGSNIGYRQRNIRRACSALSRSEDMCMERISAFSETAPVGGPCQRNYINAVAQVRTRLSPAGLLVYCKQIEQRMGRIRTVRWGPRIIDLDILFYASSIIRQRSLCIPHPRLHERLFVLAPLAELAPNFVHPVLRKTIRRLLREAQKRT